MNLSSSTARALGRLDPRPAPAFDLPRSGARRRTLRSVLTRRVLPAAIVLLTMFLFVGWFRGPTHLTPAEVGAVVHDQVTRELIERTDDYSWTVGPLDCVELKPGRGNCLADARSNAHRSDQVMVAVAYSPGTHGKLDLVVKLP